MKALREKTKNRIFYWCMLAIPLIQFVVFYVYVNFNSVVLSFQAYDGVLLNTFSPAGFENFAKIFQDFGSKSVQIGSATFNFGTAIRNSILIYVLSLLIGMPLAMIFSYYIYKKRLASTFFKIVLFAPTVISSIAVVTIFRTMADVFIPNVINQIFGTNVKALFSTENTIFVCLIVYQFVFFNGTSIMYYVGAMGNVSDSTIEAGYLDGCVGVKEFIHIIFPQIYGTFSVFFITGISTMFINQFNLFTFYAFLAPSEYATIGYILYVKLASSSGMTNYPYVAALGLLITLVTSVLIIATRSLVKILDPMR